MFFLEVLSRVVHHDGVQKCKPYIKRDKAETEKDPSASLAASDGPKDDCISNR